jgi:hypothetical protein
MVAQPLKVLGIFNGPTTDGVVEGEQRGLGPLEELLDLSDGRVQVRGVLLHRINSSPNVLQSPCWLWPPLAHAAQFGSLTSIL